MEDECIEPNIDNQLIWRKDKRLWLRLWYGGASTPTCIVGTVAGGWGAGGYVLQGAVEPAGGRGGI